MMRASGPGWNPIPLRAVGTSAARRRADRNEQAALANPFAASVAVTTANA
jgi:hypothetical protein